MKGAICSVQGLKRDVLASAPELNAPRGVTVGRRRLKTRSHSEQKHNKLFCPITAAASLFHHTFAKSKLAHIVCEGAAPAGPTRRAARRRGLNFYTL